MASAAHYQAVLQKVDPLAPAVKALHFALSGCERFDFVPGQFVTLIVPFAELGDQEPGKRSYSLASFADGQPRVELAVTRVDTGVVSRWLHGLSVGARVQAVGPYGLFTLDRPPDADLCFVATGTGIAPFRPMLRRVFEIGTRRRVTLVFGCRHEEDILYRAEFEALERAHENFRFIPTLSRGAADWTGGRGHVQEHVERDFIAPRLTDTEFYICGLKKMVDDVRQRLKRQGWDRKKLHQERYD